MSKKTKTITIIGATLLVVMGLSVGLVVHNAKAEGSFWGGIQAMVADRLMAKVDVPDMDVPMFAAMASPEVYSYMKVHGTFGYKLPVLATTTTDTSDTLTGSDMVTYGMFDVMSNVGALSYALPATSTMMSILGEVGMTRSWLFHNATSSSGITLTFTAGAGMHLVGVAGAEVIDPEEWAELTCTNIYYRDADNENILCIITELEE